MNGMSTLPPPMGLSSGAWTQLQACLPANQWRVADQIHALDTGWHPANLDAGLMAMPATVEQLSALVRCCHEWGIAMVPQGGRTGLVGGGISRPGQLIVSTAALNRIERMDAVSRVALVQSGLSLQSLQEAAAVHGLEPGIDLAARGSATIGGMLATNAGGIMAFRNGVMRHRVLGLEAVLPDGSIYSDLTQIVKNAAGYDLKHVFIGAEGTLGIITRVALSLTPLPQATSTALFGLPDMAALTDTVRLALEVDCGHLRAAEALWPEYLRLTAEALSWRTPGMSLDCPVYLLLELGGKQAERLQQTFEELYEQLLARHPDAQGVIAGSAEQARTLWRLREDTEAIYRRFPQAPSFDVSVPLARMEDYVVQVRSALEKLRPAGTPVFMFGHVADGNLHMVLGEPGPLAGQARMAVEEAIYSPLHGLGGSFSAEHGIGAHRIRALRNYCDPVKWRLMQQIKRQWDPRGLMNPGKVLDEGG